jgi:hypothetical protein
MAVAALTALSCTPPAPSLRLGLEAAATTLHTIAHDPDSAAQVKDQMHFVFAYSAAWELG